MKLALALFTGLFLALSSTLAAALPVAEGTIGAGLSPDVLDVATRSTKASPVIGEITWQQIEQTVIGFTTSSVTRDDFTKQAAGALAAQFPHLNWMVIYPEYDTREIHGTEGVNWGKIIVFKKRGGALSSLRFEIIGLESGTITSHGDGGYINWAMNGNIIRDGSRVQFLCRATGAERC